VEPDILILRFSAIGDLILTTPLLRALRARHPRARLTFVTREDMADTLRHNPRIDRLITWRHGTPLRGLIDELRAGQWTHRIDLHDSLRSRRIRWAVGGRWRHYPKHRLRRTLLIASKRRWGGDLGPVADRYFEAARDLDVVPDGRPAEFFLSREAEAAAERFLVSHRLGQRRRLVAVVPGAAHLTKRWPEASWRELIDRLSPEHDLLILGGPAERQVGASLVPPDTPGIATAAGEFSLVTSAALLKRADVVVTGDTGLLHLATAVGTPAVALYGPGVREFGFFPYRARATVLEQAELDCRPCRAHGGAVCPRGHHRCMVDTTPLAVLAALKAPIR
jgi:lipopolysaccharide heptosyltransferase II